jgi:hypothetical protein
MVLHQGGFDDLNHYDSISAIENEALVSKYKEIFDGLWRSNEPI